MAREKTVQDGRIYGQENHKKGKLPLAVSTHRGKPWAEVTSSLEGNKVELHLAILRSCEADDKHLLSIPYPYHVNLFSDAIRCDAMQGTATEEEEEDICIITSSEAISLSVLLFFQRLDANSDIWGVQVGSPSKKLPAFVHMYIPI